MTDDTSAETRLRQLMVAAQGGDRAAYAALLKELAGLAKRSVCYRYRYLTPADVEDVVQDVLLSIHSVRATYDSARPFMPWLMTIVHNRAVDAVRRFARRGARELAVAEYPETFVADEAKIPGEGYGDPEALRHAVAALPHGQRLAIEMLKLREMSLKEAAKATGMSIGALKVAAHRATKALRVSLKGRHLGD